MEGEEFDSEQQWQGLPGADVISLSKFRGVHIHIYTLYLVASGYIDSRNVLNSL